MRTAACLQRHNATRMPGEKVEQLATGQPAAEHRPSALIGTVRVENTLGDIQPDCGNL
jgi:hypothetical protein